MQNRATGPLLPLVVFLVLWTCPATAETPAANASSTPSAETAPGEVLIQLHDGVSWSQVQARYPELEAYAFGPGQRLFNVPQAEATVRATFARRSGRAPRQPQMPALARWGKVRFAADIDPIRVAKHLRELPEVRHAEANVALHLDAVPDDTYADPEQDGSWSSGAWGQSYPDLWRLQNIEADRAWDLQTGDPNLVVAVIDSGIDFAHEDLAGNAWNNPGETPGNGIDDDGNGYVDDVSGWNFALNNNDVTDRFQHGTLMAGVIGAVGDNGTGIAGVVWQVQLMAVKVSTDTGATNLTALIQGITYAADNGADVINISLSNKGEAPQALRDAIAYAHGLGAVIVVSAGNSGSEIGDCANDISELNDDLASFPACLDQTIAVGAVQHDDRIYFASNFGFKLDVTAPGSDDNIGDPNFNHLNILSTLSAQNQSVVFQRVGDRYYRDGGTSFAAAHVSGLAALVLSQQPGLSNEMVRAVVQASADDLGSGGFDDLFGWGRINAFRAVQQADAAANQVELTADLQVGRATVAVGAPLPVTVTARNAGQQSASNVTLEIFDGDPGAGGTLLYSDLLSNLGAGSAVTQQILIDLPSRGRRTLYAVVDRNDQVAEYFEQNNRVMRPVEAYSYRFEARELTSASGRKYNATIWGDRIAWADERNLRDFPDIYVYDLATDQERQVTSRVGVEIAPMIQGDSIVWADLFETPDPVDTYDISHYDLASDQETEITDGFSAEVTPDVFGDQIVWVDARAGLGQAHIWGHDLSTGQNEQLTFGGQQEAPAIWGNRMVYLNNDAPFGISVKNLATGVETDLNLGGVGLTLHPDIYEQQVVYGDSRTGSTDIYLYDLATGQERVVSNAPGTQGRPHLYGDKVVWRDQRHSTGQWDVFLYDLTFDEERRVTRSLLEDNDPHIQGNRIVWVRTPNISQGTAQVWVAEIDDFPAALSGLNGSRNGNQINLSWDASLESDVGSYAVYRSATAGGAFTQVGTTSNTSFSDSVASGTWYYRVTAIDAAGGEGAYSNEAQVGGGSGPTAPDAPQGLRVQ